MIYASYFGTGWYEARSCHMLSKLEQHKTIWLAILNNTKLLNFGVHVP